MARMLVDFPERLGRTLDELGMDGIPEDLAHAMLEAGAVPLKAAMQQSGHAMGIVRTGRMLTSIRTFTVKRRKSGGWEQATGPDSSKVYSRYRSRKTGGQEKITASNVAYVNEYGHGRLAGRPFISEAVRASEDTVIAAEEQVLDEWISKHF